VQRRGRPAVPPPRARELLARDACRGESIVDAMGERQAARSDVERRQLIGAIADDRHAERFEALEREREVEHELRAGADDAHRMLRDGLEVRGLVEGALAAAVHAADTAGGHHRDAGACGDLYRRRDRRRSQSTAREHRREIAKRNFRDCGLFRETHQKRVVGADDGLAVRDRDRGRRGTEATHLLLECACGLEVLRPRQAMCDDGGLECHDCPTRRERRSDLRVDRELHLGAAACVSGLAALAGEQLDRVGEHRQQDLERLAHRAWRTRQVDDERGTDGARDTAREHAVRGLLQ